jgi:hypothetical protein
MAVNDVPAPSIEHCPSGSTRASRGWLCAVTVTDDGAEFGDATVYVSEFPSKTTDIAPFWIPGLNTDIWPRFAGEGEKKFWDVELSPAWMVMSLEVLLLYVKYAV